MCGECPIRYRAAQCMSQMQVSSVGECVNVLLMQGLLIVDLILLFFGILSAIPVSADDAKVPGYYWLLFCRFGVGFGAGGTAQA